MPSSLIYRSGHETEQALDEGDYPRHGHATPYAAIVLSGHYLESGDTGRWVARDGDVVSHGAFEANLNSVVGRVRLLNIPIPVGARLPTVFTVPDIDALAYAARTSARDAWRLLQPAECIQPLMRDWPDILAAELRRGPVRLGAWAHDHGLASATVSRTFRAVFGETPIRYRATARARAAWRRIVDETDSLAHIALDCGFSDQAHLCRSILELTGATPTTWRKLKRIQDRPI